MRNTKSILKLVLFVLVVLLIMVNCASAIYAYLIDTIPIWNLLLILFFGIALVILLAVEIIHSIKS